MLRFSNDSGVEQFLLTIVATPNGMAFVCRLGLDIRLDISLDKVKSKIQDVQ